jgi:hypothetical protein
MIPDFIIGLYENEIRKVVEKAIEAIVDKFDLDMDIVKKVVEAKIEMSLELVPEETETFKVVKKTSTKQLPSAKNRCVARLAKGDQCKHEHSCDESKLCIRHARMLEEQGCLKFGTVNDQVTSVNLPKRKKNIF